MRGGGFDIFDALTCAVIVLMLAAFVWAMDWLAQGWSALLDATLPGGEPPEIAGSCSCRSCRNRNGREPCSDYDGD